MRGGGSERGRAAPDRGARGRVRRIGALGVFTALVVASGYAFAAIPNVKPIMLILFLAGAALGAAGGLTVALLGMGIYSVANPWGPAPPVVLAAKVLGAMMFGAAGALIAPRAAALRPPAAGALLLALAGLVLTIAYGVLVDLATAVTIGMASNPIPTLVAGVPFNAAHAVSNAILFLVAGVPLVRRFTRGRAAACTLLWAALALAAAPPARATEAAADSAAARPDSADASSDSVGAGGPLAPASPLRAAPFDAYGALDAARSGDVVVASGAAAASGGVGDGARSAVEPLRAAQGLAVERFGVVGQSERVLILGEEGVSLRVAGVPVLASRSGLAPFDILSRESFRELRVRGAAADPLLGGRAAAGTVDALVAPAGAADEPPVSSFLAERGPFEFRRYAVGFDRWIGPLRASFAYHTARGRFFDDVDHTRSRGSFLTAATSDDRALPLFVSGGTTRRELDLVTGVAGGLGRGTEERSLVVARTAIGRGSPLATRLALKDDRVAWRVASGPALRGRERETGGLVTVREGAALSFAAWGYAGRVDDEVAGATRSTERVGGSVVGAHDGTLSWRAYAGGDRASPAPARAHLGASVERGARRARARLETYLAPDHAPRALLLRGDDVRPGHRAGASLRLEAGLASPDSARWRLAGTLLRRGVRDGFLVAAADPFFADVTRATYDDWGVALDGSLRVAGARLDAAYLFLDDDASRPLPLRPRHRGHADVRRAWALPQPRARLVLRAGCEIVGERAAFDRATPLPESIDLRAAVAVEIEGVVIFLQAENLLDRYNDVLPGIYPEGRSAYLGFTWLLRD